MHFWHPNMNVKNIMKTIKLFIIMTICLLSGVMPIAVLAFTLGIMTLMADMRQNPRASS